MHSHLSSVNYLNVVVKTISFDLERLRRHRVFKKCVCFYLPVLCIVQPCKPLQAKASGGEMLCRMPVVNLPDDLSQQLNNSETGTIDDTQGPGVAVYWASDGRTRADIYVGLILDGFKLYKNISSVDPYIKMQFALEPVVSCEYDDIDVDPNKDRVISIKVNHLS